ncbi:MAG: hypothetical protein AB1445_07885 [Bacillota bacterium]
MRSTLTRDDYAVAYRWFDLATPLPFDCGTLCGKMCCSEWQPGVGMYLYPGEEAMFTQDEDWLVWEEHDTAEFEFCPEWSGKVTFIMCQRPCPRHRRPVECRTFPLAPHLTAAGALEMVLDPDGLHLCPLIRGGELEVLDPAFVTNAHRAWEVLLQDPLIRADVLWRSRLRTGS